MTWLHGPDSAKDGRHWCLAAPARMRVNRKEDSMSKGMDKKKETKKKPQRTLEEKRAAKREKKRNVGFL
jgi:hypothetical protein